MTELKTRRQWRKQDFCKIKEGEKPAAHRTLKFFVNHYHNFGDGNLIREPVLKERLIPLYSQEQIQPYSN